MISRKRTTTPWKAAVIGLVSIAVVIGSIVSLVTAPITTAEWFAGVATMAIFGPIGIVAISQIPWVATAIGGPWRFTDLRVAAVLILSLALACAAGGVSAAFAYVVDGLTEFPVSRAGTYMMPTPVFLVLCAVLSVGFGVLGVLTLRLAIRRRR